VAYSKFKNYTIPMRIDILLHEFSHKYKNPKIGLEISNEIGADINALYIYLGLGFSKIDAICVFGNVFLKAQSSGNQERMRKIMDYINKFENQEFAKLN
jgi:ferritin